MPRESGPETDGRARLLWNYEDPFSVQALLEPTNTFGLCNHLRVDQSSLTDAEIWLSKHEVPCAKPA